MRVKCRAARGFVFLGRERGFQLCVLLCPVALTLIKGVRYSAPAGLAGQNFLLAHSRRAALSFKLLQKVNSVHVGAEPRLGTALTKVLVGYMEVTRRLG